MESKTCTKCNQNKLLDEFAWKSKKLNKKSSECKTCHREVRNEYYINNRVGEISRISDRKLKIKLWIRDLKQDMCCNRCGENHAATIQFHHRDPSKKDLEISSAHTNGWSKKRILKEIEKCEVLCANCHCKEHFIV